MWRAVFLSDLHLSEATGEENSASQQLVRLLKSLPSENTTHLFLMGDVFDLWLGDHKYFIEKHREVIEALKEVVQSGIEVHYFEGNHDLYLKPFFEEQLGVKVHSDPIWYDLHGQSLYLEHGDQSDPTDRDYLFLRWLLRTPVMRWLALHLPGFLVAWLGHRSSRMSRTYTTGLRRDLDGLRQKLRSHSLRIYRQKQFRYLINGHVHLRDEFQLPQSNNYAINLGSWMQEPGYLVLDKKGHRWVGL